MKNSGQKVLSVVVLMIGIMVIGIVISHNIKTAQIESNYPIYIHDTDAKSIAIRPAAKIY